jgi:hypothetical protein
VRTSFASVVATCDPDYVIVPNRGEGTAAWLPVFPHLYRHPELVKPDLPASFFASQIIRPAIGIILYIVATALGWFARPLLAVAIFMLIVGYYAWTSQGIHPGR